MSSNVESMFYTREKPWHGLGVRVEEAPTSADALRLAGLDWEVAQEPIFTEGGDAIAGYKVNVRDSDRKVLGVVSDRYKIIQNREAFAFTDTLLGSGVRYETAGSLQEGKRVWLLARLPREYIIAGERISPYLVFSNSHDGSGAVRVALTPIRVCCNNTLNLALDTARRSWSMIHTGNISDKIQEAKDTLFMAETYMDSLGEEFERLTEQLEKLREDNAYNIRHLEIDIEIARLSGQDTARMKLQLKQMEELASFEEKYLLDLISEAEKQLGNHQLIAPFSGTVTAIAGTMMNWNGMAMSENTPMLALASEDSRFLQTDYINSEQEESYHEYYALVDGKRYELEYIPRTSEELQAMTVKGEAKTSRFRMLDAQDAKLGKNVFLCIVENYKENVLSLPKSVVYKERRNYYVYVPEGDALVKTPVEIGVQGNNYVEITSGLKEGACVYVER